MKQKKRMVQVLHSEFDVHALRQAARDGRLFILPKAEDSDAECRHTLTSILNYVSAINDCTSAKYASCIIDLWKDILASSRFCNLLTFHRGKQQGLPNKYRITALVAYLLEKGIYRKEEFTAVGLHLRLEHITHRNSIYQGMTRYYFDHSDYVALNHIISNIPDI